MHPALSVIVFTTASGAGCGLLLLSGLLAMAGVFADDPTFGAVAVAIGVALLGGGLMSSAAHLGRPERMFRAVTQWRSSWLSREGVVALATFVPAGVLFLACVFGWGPGVVAISGAVLAVLAAATTLCTAMIYASLKPIRQWRSRLVLPGYLILALMTGSLLLLTLARAFGHRSPGYEAVALAAIVGALVVKLLYWKHIDTAAPTTGLGTATGLGQFGRVRLLDPPHTEENFVMREMGYQIARRHAYKLRQIAVVTAFAAPVLLTLVGGVVPAALAVIAAGFGVLVERWLFFAEATHTSVIYYGRPG